MFGVGDYFRLRNGMPGLFIVIKPLSGNRVSGRKWPLTKSGPAEEFYHHDIELVRREDPTDS